MARTTKFHEQRSSTGWPVFSSTQTDNRIALCRKALCPNRSLTIKFKDCYDSLSSVESLCKLKFIYAEYFAEHFKKVNELGWGGRFSVPRNAHEGAFYPFIRCMERHRPVDSGCVWIGTRHEYPRIYVNNHVADWLCPYSRMGYILTEPFEPLSKVIANWDRLCDKRFYPDLDLPPIPEL